MKTVFRYFFDFMDEQEKWLNSMSEHGYRLKKCGKLTYCFDECKPNEYEYAVEFVGDKSYSKAKDYRKYLEEMGFRTFTKNINLNFSYGKIKWRPYAKGMGQISTSPGGFNKELLILEKKKDGKPFELYTDASDMLNIYKVVRNAYAWAFLMMLGIAAVSLAADEPSSHVVMVWAVRAAVVSLGVLFAVYTAKYSSLVNRLKEESKIFE